ncbi:ABC transporter six-transmembrane domain-containing protein [Microbulbifer sp. GL-2]|uniref:ABC transporter six-transmembrane domain-containing protein n=1 Tax=Microbulbifer sp. GL-2 TaxID=2591606 RepID=UPI001163B297|nr:ABC transporter six-transmembrane domain-containing protein [Microbulbifer sp. GL-2]BBM04074.1 membrane protein [Microbulbifer sp. GL-2]
MTQPVTTVSKSTADDYTKDRRKHSLLSIFTRFKWRVSLTLSLVVIETLLELLFPLSIGWAINGLLEHSYAGIYLLAGLGTISVLIGSARRFYDTRIYAHIYQVVISEMVTREKAKRQSVSTITARSSLLTEIVEFFENTMPEVITTTIGMVGLLIIISAINLNIFLACLALLALIILIYFVIGNANYQLNESYNNELEYQVDAIKQPNAEHAKAHFRRLMRWNIELSDLETGTYLILWAGILALFVYAPIAAIDEGLVNYGLIIALLMYVFDFIGKVSALPLYVQQVIRLKEISNRIGS